MDEAQTRRLLVEIAATIASGVDTTGEAVLAGLVFGLEVSASAPELAALLRSVLPTDPTARALNDQLGGQIRELLTRIQATEESE
jgi:hypothetical protein